MIQLPFINDPLERECTEYATNYITRYINLNRQPLQQLMYYRNDYRDTLVIQPPYKNDAGDIQYNDLSILSKSKKIDFRYEFSSLNPTNSTLKGKALIHAFEAHNVPEQILILVLLGDGYHNMVEYTLRSLIKPNRLPVMLITSMEEYRKHIDMIFTRNIKEMARR
jgi:hypothetical protein